MSIERKIKKVLLLLQLVEMEEEEFESLDAEYASHFQRDFQLENDYLNQQKQEPASSTEDKNQKPNTEDIAPMKKQDLKYLHRKLAKVTHPDIAGEECEEEFKKIQKAYDAGDGATLLKEAVKRNIEVNISEDVYFSMKKNLNSRREMLNRRTNTIQWMWCTSDKSDKTRKEIQKIMGIDSSEYEKWLSRK